MNEDKPPLYWKGDPERLFKAPTEAPGPNAPILLYVDDPGRTIRSAQDIADHQRDLSLLPRTTTPERSLYPMEAYARNNVYRIPLVVPIVAGAFKGQKATGYTLIPAASLGSATEAVARLLFPYTGRIGTDVAAVFCEPGTEMPFDTTQETISLPYVAYNYDIDIDRSTEGITEEWKGILAENMIRDRVRAIFHDRTDARPFPAISGRGNTVCVLECLRRAAWGIGIPVMEFEAWIRGIELRDYASANTGNRGSICYTDRVLQHRHEWTLQNKREDRNDERLFEYMIVTGEIRLA